MKLQFFGSTNPPLPFDVCLNIFSFVQERPSSFGANIGKKGRHPEQREGSPDAALSPIQEIPHHVRDDVLLWESGALVNKRWAAFYKDTRRTLAVLPTLYTIPEFDVVPEALEITQLSGGLTNGTFKLDIKSKTEESWVLRIAGKGTAAFINRMHEKDNALKASKLGLNVSISWFDHKGTQLTPFLKNSQPLSSPRLNIRKYLPHIADLFKTLHGHSEPFENILTIENRINHLFLMISNQKADLLPREISEIEYHLKELFHLLSFFSVTLTSCHNDPTITNFLVIDNPEIEKRLYLIDWEYASQNDRLWDLVYFCLIAKLDAASTDAFLSYYFEDINETIKAWYTVYMPLVTWWITLWSYTQMMSDSLSADMESYHQWAEEYLALTLDLFRSSTYRDAFLVISREKEHNLDAITPRAF